MMILTAVSAEMATSSSCWSPRRWDSSSQSHGALVALVRASHACCRSGKRLMSLIAGTSRHASCAACWGMQVRQGRLLNPLLVGSIMSCVEVDEGFISLVGCGRLGNGPMGKEGNAAARLAGRGARRFPRGRVGSRLDGFIFAHTSWLPYKAGLLMHPVMRAKFSRVRPWVVE